MSTPRLFDSHCHLDLLARESSAPEILDACAEVGVSRILVPGISATNWPDVMAVQSSRIKIFRAFGLHPYFTHDHQRSDLERLAELGIDNDCVAIGEIGLDYQRKDLDPKRQQYFFERQLRLANEAELPVVLHARKSHHDVLRYLNTTGFGWGGLVHAFSGSREIADQYVARGFVLGFGGAVTWNRATRLRRLVADLPAVSLVLETDAPDMRPSFDRERVNSPLNLPGIADIIAQLRGESIEDLAQATTANALRALKLDETEICQD